MSKQLSLSNLQECEDTICLSYSKVEYSIVDCSNREVTRHVRALIYDICDNTEWEDLVMVHSAPWTESATTVTKHLIRDSFGNTIMVDRGILYDYTTTNDKISPCQNGHQICCFTRINSWRKQKCHKKNRKMTRTQHVVQSNGPITLSDNMFWWSTTRACCGKDATQ